MDPHERNRIRKRLEDIKIVAEKIGEHVFRAMKLNTNPEVAIHLNQIVLLMGITPKDVGLPLNFMEIKDKK
jgi:hypothetical protein